MADTQITDAVKENAKGPSAASGDSGSVTQHRIADQIEADRYLKAAEAVAKPHRGVRYSRYVPGS